MRSPRPFAVTASVGATAGAHGRIVTLDDLVLTADATMRGNASWRKSGGMPSRAHSRRISTWSGRASDGLPPGAPSAQSLLRRIARAADVRKHLLHRLLPVSVRGRGVSCEIEKAFMRVLFEALMTGLPPFVAGAKTAVRSMPRIWLPSQVEDRASIVVHLVGATR